MFKLIAGCFALLPMTVMACTNITLKAGDDGIVVARTLEFGVDLQSKLVTVPRGQRFTNQTPQGQSSLSWRGRYGYVYLNALDKPMVVDGMNEKGLSVGMLYLPGYTTYARPTDDHIQKGIAYFQFGAWALSQFQTIAEVKQALKTLVVFEQPLSIPNYGEVVFPLHAVITDATGESLTVEFVDGDVKVHDNPLGLLTNAPTFDWQLNNLKNYVNLTPVGPDPIKLDGLTYSATGQGAGMFGLPGDVSPPSRFVRMAFLTNNAYPAKNNRENVILAGNLISNVFIVKGMVRGKTKLGGEADQDIETTQWTVIKDLNQPVFYFKTYHQPTLQSVNLNKLNFQEGAESLVLDINHPAPLAMDVTDKFK